MRMPHVVSSLPLALPLVLLACTSPGGTRVTPAEYERIEPPRPPSVTAREQAAPAGPDKPLSDELVEEQQGLDGRVIALDRRREDLERDRAELERKRHRVAIEQEGAEASEALALERALREHEKAVDDLAHLAGVEHPRRLEEDALGLRGSWDNLLEVREELAQLEMMYDAPALGDATAEIVLNRTKRRLERMEAGHALREQRSAELKERTLPREMTDAELELRAKTVALEEARRKLELGRLGREAALRDLEQEVRELEREQQDIEREAGQLAADRERWDRKVARHRAAPTGLGPAEAAP
jgi:hypothetical protein